MRQARLSGCMLPAQVTSSWAPPRLAALTSDADAVLLDDLLVPEVGVVPKDEGDLAATERVANFLHLAGTSAVRVWRRQQACKALAKLPPSHFASKSCASPSFLPRPAPALALPQAVALDSPSSRSCRPAGLCPAQLSKVTARGASETTLDQGTTSAAQERALPWRARGGERASHRPGVCERDSAPGEVEVLSPLLERRWQGGLLEPWLAVRA